MKEYMMAAVKRKRDQMKQYQSDDESAEAEGSEMDHDGDSELAPPSGASKHDHLLGSPVKSGNGKQVADVEDAHHQNETALGQQGGLQHDGKVTSPANSKNLFVDVKTDPHDPVDLNRDRNMAGDGSNSKYDKMGVDEHKDVRLQASKLSGINVARTQMLKDQTRKAVKSSMDIKDNNPSHGEDSVDAVSEANNQVQRGFPAPKSDVNRDGNASIPWDQDAQGVDTKGKGLYDVGETEGADDKDESRKRMGGMKGARARLDGFLSKVSRKKA